MKVLLLNGSANKNGNTFTALSILALLLMMAVTGATAQTTYTVTVKGGTEDAARWSANPISAGEGQGVTVKYNGKKKVKRVTAAKKAAAHPQAEGHALTAAALGEIVGSETDHATYKHGLAIALSDEGKMKWRDAIRAYGHKAAFNGTAWMLPSKNQWDAMLNANGGHTGLNAALAAAGGNSSKLQENVEDGYWSSTMPDDYDAWLAHFDKFDGLWHKSGLDYYEYVRACLAF